MTPYTLVRYCDNTGGRYQLRLQRKVCGFYSTIENVLLCIQMGYHCFEGTYCLLLQIENTTSMSDLQ
jgi:hypothetical protein